ncbi:PglL family O-oligosaccharyltransferase [Tepidimonas fonticaldi]|uniref:PglL family O-oligosaccharyltransferase n=1 Tax=Tepidimonas fonticaldi TaxID=1101373 RepID=UPI0018D2975A|nr:O-antigen ligase family protein [Tepidimonas fonticaldi]
MPVVVTLLLTALISSAIAILQWSDFLDKDSWAAGAAFLTPNQGTGRAVANIGHPNNLGTLLVIGLWCALWVAQQPAAQRLGRHVRTLLLALVVAVLTFGVYLSGSRTAQLNLLLAPMLTAAWLLWRHGHLRHALLAWVAVPAALLFAFQAATPVFTEWLGLPSPPEDRPLTQDSQRLRLWAMAWTAVLQHPWIGNGPAAMAQAHLELSPVYGAIDYSIAAHAHNTVLDLLLMFGLPAGGAIAAAVAWLWWRAARGAHDPQRWLPWLMVTAMLVHALLEYPLHYGFFLWLMCLLLGYLTGQPGRPVALRWPLATGIGWLLACALVAYPVWRGYVEVEKLYTLFRQQGAAAVRAALPDAHPFSKALYPGLLARVDWLSRPAASLSNLTDAELAALERTTRNYPLPGLLWRTAVAYGFRGDAQKAAWYGERLCAMFHPGLCKAAITDWPALGAGRADWPELPWARWLLAPVPGRR